VYYVHAHALQIMFTVEILQRYRGAEMGVLG
jgi:hypothetical protein